jgi:medium-chain acyl-[acyl-carrier-protein] hydrolase
VILARSAWLPFVKTHPAARLTMFCFHHAGGGASTFRAWPQLLPSEVEVAAVQLPGREGRLAEPAMTNCDAVVNAVLAGLPLEAPFVFFGHSMGARVAFELARALRRRGAELPLQLIVSGCRAPHVPRREELKHLLPDAELRAELARYAGTPKEVIANDELMAVLLPTIRADFEVIESAGFRSEPPLAIPITALGGTADEEVTREDLEAWREHTTAEFARRMFVGNHFFVQHARGQVVEAVARELSKWLAVAAPLQ